MPKGKGTSFSDGTGIIVLKRLDDAIRDNDHIYATIKGAALNNDGSDKASFTAPSVRGQAEVIAMAQADAGCEPERDHLRGNARHRHAAR
jgi:acyl transferase domain-containing protein